MADEGLCGESGEEAAIHADEVGAVHVDQLFQDRFDFGMVAAECEDAPAGEEVEIFVSLFVPEVAAFAADVLLVEADGAEHFDEGGVEVLLMKIEALSLKLLKPGGKIVVHVQRTSFRRIGGSYMQDKKISIGQSLSIGSVHYRSLPRLASRTPVGGGACARVEGE